MKYFIMFYNIVSDKMVIFVTNKERKIVLGLFINWLSKRGKRKTKRL